MSSFAKRAAMSTRPAVAACTSEIRRPTSAATAGSIRPSRSSAFQTGCVSGASHDMAKSPAVRSSPISRGTASGTISPATRIHSASLWLRATGARQSAATLSFGSACFTQKERPATSTRAMSEDTPPGSGVTTTSAPRGTRSRRWSASRSPDVGAGVMRRFDHEPAAPARAAGRSEPARSAEAAYAAVGSGVCPPP